MTPREPDPAPEGRTTRRRRAAQPVGHEPKANRVLVIAIIGWAAAAAILVLVTGIWSGIVTPSLDPPYLQPGHSFAGLVLAAVVAAGGLVWVAHRRSWTMGWRWALVGWLVAGVVVVGAYASWQWHLAFEVPVTKASEMVSGSPYGTPTGAPAR